MLLSIIIVDDQNLARALGAPNADVRAALAYKGGYDRT
jgi:hypothetical protein